MTSYFSVISMKKYYVSEERLRKRANIIIFDVSRGRTLDKEGCFLLLYFEAKYAVDRVGWFVIYGTFRVMDKEWGKKYFVNGALSVFVDGYIETLWEMKKTDSMDPLLDAEWLSWDVYDAGSPFLSSEISVGGV